MIRPFSLGDILTLKRLGHTGVGFDLERLLLYAPSPIHAAVLGLLTRHHLGSITCLRESANGKGEGFVQVYPRADRSKWDLAYLSPALGSSKDAPELWRQLLSYLIVLGAEQQVHRIYARIAEDAEIEDLLRQVGFTLVMREEVFCLETRPASAPRPAGLRELHHGDIEALNRLHCEIQPQLVQQAEGACPCWQAPPQRLLSRSASLDAFVWEDGGQIQAYLGLVSSVRGHWLQLLVRPDRRADLLPYIRFVLGTVSDSQRGAIYCSVPDRCVGLGWLLRTCGFESYARQVLLVAHTMARVPVQRGLVVPGLEGGIDVSTPVGHVLPQSVKE